MQESDGQVLRNGLNEISELGDSLHLSEQTTEKAKQLYRDGVESDACSFVGRGVTAIAAATMLIAARETGEVRTADEISEQIPDHISAKRIHRTTKYICSELGLGLVVADPIDFVDRIAEKLDADAEDVEIAKGVVQVVKDDGVAINQAASSVAATAFYYVGAHDRGHGRYTQHEVADTVDVSTLTIRNNYREYSDVLSEHSISEIKEAAP